MLSQMRSGIAGIFAKILLVILMLSFVVWGVGDMVRMPGQTQMVAEVGKVSISQAAFKQAYQREAERVRQSLGKQYTPGMLKQLGLRDQVLNRLIYRSLVEQESIALGLLPGDEAVLTNIRENPAFHGMSGKFDKQRFIGVLERNRMSEKDYIEQLRRSLAVGALMRTLDKPAVPEVMTRTLYQVLQETRDVTVYTLPSAKIRIDVPDEKAVEAYYQANPAEFSVPEYRTLSYVTFKAEDIQKNMSVTEADVKRLYEERKDEFKKPERRQVDQYLFSDEASAKAAHEALTLGKAAGKKPVAMGLVERERVMKEAADAVFSMKEGEFSAPVRSAFGWHVFHVSKIEPPRTLSFDETRELLEKDARAQAAEAELTRFSNQIEDALAGGSSLTQTAKDLGLTLTALAPVDQSGNGADGKPLAALPKLDKFLNVAFATSDQADSGLTFSKGGDYYIVHVDRIEPSRVKPLADVRAAAASGAQKEARAARTAELAQEIGKSFSDASARAALIAKHGLTSSVIKAMKRGGESVLSPALVNEIFEQQQGMATAMHGSANGDYSLAVVNAVTRSNALPPADESLAIKRSLEEVMQGEALDQYIAYLKRKHGVTMHTAAVEAATEE